MPKVTSKLQVTVPKALAEAHGLEPGTEIDFESAGDTIRMRVRADEPPRPEDTEQRLRSFDEATERQSTRDERFRRDSPELVRMRERGWSREELYDRGLAD